MFSDLRFRLRALFNRGAVEREMNDELRFHLDHQIAKLVAAGVPRDEAERRARIAFGGIDRIREDTRDARGVNRVETLTQDLHYALRGIRMRPGFAGAIVLTLALGIGANTAMFTIVDRLLFRPPTYIADAGRVQRVYLTWNTPQGQNTDRFVEYTRYLDLTRWTTSFDKTAVVGERTLAVGDGTDARDMIVVAASASFFDLFRMHAAAGRFYTTADDHVPVGDPVAVISYAYWQSHFGGRADAIGQRLHVGTMLLTIIGVTPRGFEGITDGAPPAVFVPVTTFAGSRSKDYFRTFHWSWLEMFVRLKPGIPATAATTDLTEAYRRSWIGESEQGGVGPIEQARPQAAIGSLHLSRGPQASANSKVLRWVMGIALIVLLVACANVANLLLSRAVARRREIGLRVALGVSRARLLQQLVMESLALAALGGVAGLLLANWGGRILRALFIKDESLDGIVGDGRTLLFVTAATVIVAIVTGVAPAIHALRGDANDALKAGSRDSAYRRSRFGTALLLLQGAVSVALLIGAGLFVRSLANVRSARLGYDVGPTLLVDANMRDVKLTNLEQNALNRRLLAAAQAIPGVVAATITTSVPFYSSESRGTPIAAGKDSSIASSRYLLQAGTTDYFRTVGTRIIAGRGFEPTDHAGTSLVAVIGKGMADKIWPGENPIGKQFKLESDTTPFFTVVGVAEDAIGLRLRGSNELWYYLPLEQYESRFGASYPDLFIRINGRSDAMVETVRRQLQPLMPGSSYVNVMTLGSIVSRVEQSWQFGATMFVAFGGLALVLAAIGLYSVIAYAVAQRTRELGVRIALGASSGRVVRMIVGESVSFAVAGIVIGGAIALGAARWIEPLLFDEKARDPLVYSVVAMTLLVAALVAALRPAMRAVRVDPAEVLRTD